MLKPKLSARFKRNYNVMKRRGCDMVLIYKIDSVNLFLHLERTGSHSDLF
ncbi:MAG: hypothetical protein FWF77_00615 [Defluviitaleaceae bacterium]|nr:hypothetical protein [Defluviitaleaceae bacterium]